VTKWKVTSDNINTLTQELVVARPTGNPSEFRAAGRSIAQTVNPGPNAFDTRIPVQQGDRLGIHGDINVGALFCPEGKLADVVGIVDGTPFLASGAPTIFGESSELQTPISAVVEPDVDGDGYGDETQDKCPQLAAFQVECPPIALDTFAVVAKSSVTLLVVSDRPTQVTVGAHAGHKSKSARASGRGPGLFVLKGGTQTVTSGKLSKFKLPFSPKLKAKLHSLSHDESLKLTIDATSKNEAGRLSSKTVSVKLRGQG
jgi:hypothetical protein